MVDRRFYPDARTKLAVSLSRYREAAGQTIERWAVFNECINAFWQQKFSGDRCIYDADDLQIAVSSALDDEQGMILVPTDGKKRIVVQEKVACTLRLDEPGAWTMAAFVDRLSSSGGGLCGADNLFYYSAPALADLPNHAIPATVRALTPADRPAFDAFTAAMPAKDFDTASVELDHWRVFGAFEQDRLVCAGSVYAWWHSCLADMGVLTLPESRGNGHARGVVRAMSVAACREGLEPQYRCQLDNQASAAVARAVGMRLYGTLDEII
ncbi:GNAT family N-acetyltransferase [Burkholderia sp. AU45274]|uniref:GNAT family N-acetyltransferase n=1 Tax=Burkholderia sp. AU45274 TaxID=3059205 RepID=UPI002654915E|nr:GNAT family N-acetyltransferase [Burkholderia sp. AU45274]MDN7489397.1 GNAT family N-acetyltransferase [Burkholderia sp. AU45274]